MHHSRNVIAALALLAMAIAGGAGGDGPPKRLIPPPRAVDEKPDDKPPTKPAIKAGAKADDGVPSSKAASQATAIPNKAAGIELVPEKESIPSTKRFQIVTAKADGKVKWLVFNRSKDPIEWLELPGTKSIQVFPNYGQDDVITVYAYTGGADGPSDPVKSVITVGKEEKKAPPKGDVDNPGDKDPPKEKEPPKKAAFLHMTIITDVELTKANPPLAALIASADLKSGIENRGHKMWIMDQKKDVERIKSSGFDDYIRKIARLPIYIIQDDQGAVVDSGLMPATLVAALQKLDAIIPPKSD